MRIKVRGVFPGTNPLSTARKISAACIFLAALWTAAFILTVFNRALIAWTADDYRPAKFQVTGACYSLGNTHNFGSSWWLIGTVEGPQERLIPNLGAGNTVTCVEDLTSRFPVNSTMNVIYNPAATTDIIQHETLRVRQDTGDPWGDERRKCIWLFWRAGLPLPLTIVLYVFVRRTAARAAKADAARSTVADSASAVL